MNKVWFEGSSDKEARKKQLNSFKVAFSELKAVLEKTMPEIPKGDFSNPSWAYEQAYYLGKRDMLNYVLKTMEIE